jgi:hypothetical protein
LNPNRLVLTSAVLISAAGAIAAGTGIFYMIGDYQLGGMGMSLGLFMIGLAWLGVRRFNRASWMVLGIAGVPALAISAFGGFVEAGTFDVWSYLSTAALVVFISGMAIPASVFRTINVSNKLMP